MKQTYCIIAAIAVPIFGVLIFFAAVLGIGGLGGDGQGEDPGSGVTGETVNPGTLTDEVPTALGNLFKDAGGQVGVPAALLAAISQQECNRVWVVPEATLTRLITNNEDFPLRAKASNTDLGHLGCAYDNGSNVWGPMQFQYMTFFGFPTKSSCGGSRCYTWEALTFNDTWARSIAQIPRFNPANHPAPLPGAPGGQSSAFTGHRPASIISLKDTVFAAAIKLRADAGRGNQPKSADWTLSEVTKAACSYYGQCSFDGVNYGNDVTRNYTKYRQKLEATP
jgi:hypothetical protein